MLFEINSTNQDFDDIAFEYFNLPKKSYETNSVVEPSKGLVCGNMFKDEYQQYKNYKPNRLSFKTEREKLLLRILELDFAINDLSLKLDINPDDYELYELFRKYAVELKRLCEDYSKKYEVLNLIDDINGKYTWIKNPWPWDGGKNYV